MEITGIGVRYSGKYRIISVTHTLDSNGYNSKCSGNSQMLAAGGVVIPSGAPKGQNDDVARRVLNTPSTSSTLGDDQTGEDYRKEMLKK
jgi:hypothetical protein